MNTRIKKYKEVRKRLHEENKEYYDLIKDNKRLSFKASKLEYQNDLMKYLIRQLAELIDEIVDHMTDCENAQSISKKAEEIAEDFERLYIK